MTAETEIAENEKAVADLLDLMDLEVLEHNLYRGVSPDERWQRVFGGQVIGQALVAASRTVDDDRPCHSLHCYFLRPGDPKIPIIYEVDRIRDGRSFTTRRVVAIQHGKAIFSLAASFQVPEDGPEHDVAPPEYPGPEGLINEREHRAKLADKLPEHIKTDFLRPRPIETRQVDPKDFINPQPREPKQAVWVRAAAPLPDDSPIALHQCLLGYASDMMLLDTCVQPHGLSWFKGEVQTASLDHAMWFQRPFRADEWLLYVMDSPSSGGARGLNRGTFYDVEGRVVASVAQEGLVRIDDGRSK
ncbi:MAG: acyl-CoA thioesterase [Alphaproteobacteria bacterium]